MPKKKVKTIPLRITDTTLRDAHQSLWATRLRTDDIMNIIDVIDSAGYYSLEMWGGATFDVCLRFLRENPWERLRMIKSRATKTPLQMLLRGQNIVGYKNYADDLLDRFIALACYNGIDIFRVFDALNDTRNLEYAVKAIKRYGGHVQGTLCYTISPYHTIDTFVKSAKEQVELGIDTLCIKDMAGILSPIAAEQLVSALVKAIDVPIQLHCHSSSGMSIATYVEGVRAGAGAIDCAISPVAGFSSQPPVETMVSIFKETEFSTEINFQALQKIAQFFKDIAPKMRIGHESLSIIDPEIIIHQIPGGMISNLRSQLAQQKALDKIDDVLTEVPRVRADLGFPPLVTPTSQIVGTQAVLNILTGERYKVVPNELKNYVKGLYGRPPAKIAPNFVKLILGDEKPITHRPADDIEPMLPKAIENLDSRFIEHEEDIISYCLFPEQALEYFKWRTSPPELRPLTPVDLELADTKRGEETSLKEPISEVSGKNSEKGAVKSFLSHADYSGLNAIMDKINELNIVEFIVRKGDASILLRAHADAGSYIQSESPSLSDEKPVQKERPETTLQDTSQVTQVISEESPSQKSPPKTINSPLVGKFYSTTSPGKSPYVEIGHTVNAGDTVCIVESMKLINDINTPVKCKILNILVRDGDNIEKGQPLMEIEEL
ncbi:MAG TPA: pyruvate carboxylase subunit B [Anaerolineae bacterium]|nr:pyruvate carboxylase subunit B [Anaerolineae bacterium]